MKSEVLLDVRYYETDQMGIVHHSNYIRYFECARNKLMCDAGYPIEKCEADGIVFPILSVNCNYKHPAKMGDKLRCTAEITQRPLARLYVKQEVYNQDGILCVEGETVLGFLDAKTRRPMRCPQQIYKMLGFD